MKNHEALSVRILTPEGTLFEGAVEAVFLPGTMGAFEVLPGHAPLISTLGKGEVRWKGPEGEDGVAIKGGAVRVLSDNIEICAEV